jgi:hypothetical protein
MATLQKQMRGSSTTHETVMGSSIVTDVDIEQTINIVIVQFSVPFKE